jgi:hypothetical protein
MKKIRLKQQLKRYGINIEYSRERQKMILLMRQRRKMFLKERRQI